MKNRGFMFFVAIIMSFTALTNNIDPLFEKVFPYMEPDTNDPSSFKWAPSSLKLSYLFDRDGDGNNDLWIMNMKTSEKKQLVNSSLLSGEISEEEKKLKERMRVGGGGIAFYAWMNHSDRLIFSAAGKLYIADSETGKIKKVNIDKSPVLFPKVSPDDKRIGFVSGGEVYVIEIESEKLTQLTHSASEFSFNGMAEYGAAEELDRHEGFWFSPDNQSLYFTHVDESKMPLYLISMNTSLKPKTDQQKYPFAGQTNPTVTLHQVSLDGKNEKELNIPVEGEYYVARVDFLEKDLMLQVISRDQKDLTLFRYKNGQPENVIHEHNNIWINLHSHFRYLRDKKSFIWSSEKSGFRHLSMVSPDGKEKALTSGKWVVRNLCAVTDEAVYFTANKDNANQTHLFSMDFESGQIVKITHVPGSHRINMSNNGNYYVDSYSTLNSPARTEVVNLQTGKRNVMIKTELADVDGLCDMVIERVSFKASDGTVLYGVLEYDRNMNKQEKHPVVVYTYGGPHGQVAADSFRARTFYWHNYLATKGFILFRMDNRGSSNRGIEFEQAIHKNMGDLELRDHIDGLNYISETFNFVDRKRAGLWGWSYGGYMACISMTRFAGEFKAAAGVAPVSDWHLYDAPYTERYMETPETNSEGYKSSSVLSYAEKLVDPLLIIHGISDDNVHFNHTELMLGAFVKHEKYPEVMVYPGKKHSIRGKMFRKHVYWKITDFFIRHLTP